MLNSDLAWARTFWVIWEFINTFYIWHNPPPVVKFLVFIWLPSIILFLFSLLQVTKDQEKPKQIQRGIIFAWYFSFYYWFLFFSPKVPIDTTVFASTFSHKNFKNTINMRVYIQYIFSWKMLTQTLIKILEIFTY